MWKVQACSAWPRSVRQVGSSAGGGGVGIVSGADSLHKERGVGRVCTLASLMLLPCGLMPPSSTPAASVEERHAGSEDPITATRPLSVCPDSMLGGRVCELAGRLPLPISLWLPSPCPLQLIGPDQKPCRGYWLDPGNALRV